MLRSPARLLVTVLLLAATASAQERVQQGTTALRLDAVDTTQAGEGLFIFYASLLDEYFKSQSETDGASWTIYFDGEPKEGEATVSELRGSEQGAVAAVFVIARDDKSLADGVFKTTKEGVQRILGKLRPGKDWSAAVVYANSALDSGFARDHNETSTWLEDVKGKGPTPALFDAVERALGFFPSKFNDVSPNRTIVVVSDGADRFSGKKSKVRDKIDKIISNAESLNVRISVIGVAYNTLDDDELKRLKDLARRTGGTYRQADDLAQIDQYLSHVEDEIARQQVITFKTSGFEAKATGLKIAVNSKGVDYVTADRILKLPEPKSDLWLWVAIGAGGLVGLGLLFFIVKLIAGLIGGRQREGPRASGPEMGKCRQCGNVRPADWKICKYCEALPHLGRLMVSSGGELNGVTFFIKDSLTNIGSADGNTFVVDDPSVSKRHAGIKVQDSRFELADYGSTNGVLVNGQRITKQFLRDGDTIGIGMVELEFKLKS